MIEIKKGIVFSNDIKKILNGINAFDYSYKFIPSDSVINAVREDFKEDVNKISNQYIDDRKRLKCICAKTTKEALEKAIDAVMKK